jgi:hypothetical protein
MGKDQHIPLAELKCVSEKRRCEFDLSLQEARAAGTGSTLRTKGPGKYRNRELESTYLMVLPDLSGVLYFVAHPHPGRNALRRRGWKEEDGAKLGISVLAWRDSRRWFYRGTEFSASRPDSGE